MSESTAVATTKAEPPQRTRRQPLNHRKALAGKYILENPSCVLKEALVRAGYTETTASNPARNNLTADHCLAELRKLAPHVDPATAVEDGLATLQMKLAQCTYDEESLRKANLGQLARCVEVLNRWYGDRIPKTPEIGGDFVDKVEWLAGIVAEIRSRGARTVDVVALSPGEDAASDNA